MSMALANNSSDTIGSKSVSGFSLFATTVQKFIAETYGPLGNRAKLLAKDASHGDHKVSHHTARAWISGKRQPCHRSVEILAARKLDLADVLENDRIRLREAVTQSKGRQ